MWYLKVLLSLSMVVCSTTYDHELYKNCSRVLLCDQNRLLPRQNRFRGVIVGSTYVQGVANIEVQNIATSEEYSLIISAIEGDVFRVQFNERDSSRYRLEYMLAKEPRIVNFDDVQLTLNSITLVVGGTRAVINISPLSVEFYHEDQLQLVLEGDRLTLQILEGSTPFTFGVRFPSASRLYGLHEHADHLALRTTTLGGYDPYRLRTMDLTYYELYDTQAMYGAVPVLYGHGQSASGVFVHNAAEEWVEITNDETNGPQAYFMVDSGTFDIFILLGPLPEDAAKQYVSLTGLPELPPIWSLGYHQSRWGYWDETDVQTVVGELESKGFPLDAIWLDIQHTDDDKFFTWNPENFSTPIEMLNNLADTHRHLVVLTDPHFKKEEGYFIYDQGIANNYFIKNPNGTVYEAECWPGTSVWLDYLNPEVRAYYSSLFLYENWPGTTSTLSGIWNDMNEAAIFNDDDEKTFPYDVVHYGGVPNRNIHNIYGLLQVMSTYNGLLQRDDNKRRPWILTRSHTAGTQRYSAIWTGDNTAEWGFIPISYSMCLNAALSGISFCGADIGGFWGEPDDELLQRFFQSGAWLPFFREHSGQESPRREPYLFSEEIQSNLNRTMRRRYEHLPYWYTVFYEHTHNGDPVIRPLWYEYPNDPEVLDIDDQILVGSNILVKAVSEPGVSSVQMYFPGGQNLDWFEADLEPPYPIYSGSGWTEVPVTLDKIPTFYREGSIIPVKPYFEGCTWGTTTGEMNDGLWHLYILLDDKTLSANGTLYTDDEISFEYRDSKTYSYINIETDYRNLDIRISYIDESNSDGIKIIFPLIMFMIPDEEDGFRKRKFTKKIYDRTADGTLLKDITYNKRMSHVIKL